MIIQAGDQEVMMGSNYNKELTTQVMKGKRTKRQRPSSPLALGMNCTSSSGESPEREPMGVNTNEDDNINKDENINKDNLELSPSTSAELSETAVEVGEEEQDMANCLILLAQGGHHLTRSNNLSYKRPSGIVTHTTSSLIKSSSGLEVYQCKTCNRCFPSFQALGGHRASHKKLKVTHHQEEKSKPLLLINREEDRNKEDQNQTRGDNTNTTLSLHIPRSGGVAKSNKVHECSICGAEFTSGQALGGHMRRHRPLPSPSTTATTAAAAATTTTTTLSLGKINSPEESQEFKKPRTSSLELDLNLPAEPEDDHGRESKFPVTSNKEQVIVFSATPLVDCHY